MTYGVLGPVVKKNRAVRQASEQANNRLTAVHPNSCAALEETDVSFVSPGENPPVGNNAVLLFKSIVLT